VLIVMSKIRLYVKCRKTGCRIASVPLQQLVKLSGFGQRRWEFKRACKCKGACMHKDGWLTLEAM